MITNRQKYLQRENKVLRRAYEDLAGEVSDRQWRRIKRDLQIQTSSLSEVLQRRPDVETYAYLRLNSPKASIKLSDVRNFGRLLAEFPVAEMQGADLLRELLDAAERHGNPVHPSTLYKWARAVGGMDQNRMYDRKDICFLASKLYVAKIAPNQQHHAGLVKAAAAA